MISSGIFSEYLKTHKLFKFIFEDEICKAVPFNCKISFNESFSNEFKWASPKNSSSQIAWNFKFRMQNLHPLSWIETSLLLLPSLYSFRKVNRLKFNDVLHLQCICLLSLCFNIPNMNLFCSNMQCIAIYIKSD